MRHLTERLKTHDTRLKNNTLHCILRFLETSALLSYFIYTHSAIVLLYRSPLSSTQKSSRWPSTSSQLGSKNSTGLSSTWPRTEAAFLKLVAKSTACSKKILIKINQILFCDCRRTLSSSRKSKSSRSPLRQFLTQKARLLPNWRIAGAVWRTRRGY